MQQSTFIQPKRVHTPVPSLAISAERSWLLQLRLSLLHVCVLGLSMVLVEPPTMAPVGSLILLAMLCSIVILDPITSRQFRSTESVKKLTDVTDGSDVDDLNLGDITREGEDVKQRQLLHAHLEESIAYAIRSGRRSVIYSVECSNKDCKDLTVLMPELVNALSEEMSSRSSVVHTPSTPLRVLSDSASGNRFSFRLAHRLMNRCEQWLCEKGVEGAVVAVGISQFPDHGRDPQQLLDLADTAARRSVNRHTSRCSMAISSPEADSSNVIALPVCSASSSNTRQIRIHA